MLDIGWQELFIIAGIAIVVVGPKDLPRVLSMIMKWVRKARGLAREFQSGIDEVVREAELDDIRKQVEDGGKFDIGKEIESAIDPDGDMVDQFTDLEQDLDSAAKTATTETDPQPTPIPPPDDGDIAATDKGTAAIEPSENDTGGDKDNKQATG
jgi:sec-independent protein translocase protein TatB